ncbi:MAG: cytochrome o ubiquinol oxidase subunit III [Candidatus Dasytiphilus stammeri]
MSNKAISHYVINAKKVFGFWIYLMSDCILFASLFATYAVLVNGTADGPMGKEIFNLPLVLLETACLLLSSVSYGIAMVRISQTSNVTKGMIWLGLTWMLGLVFIYMEMYEFHKLVTENYGPQRSGFLSIFFTLVGTHGLHVISGLVWMAVLIYQLYKRGLTTINRTRMECLSLFWHFLDVIWICVFTVVYLIGSL